MTSFPQNSRPQRQTVIQGAPIEFATIFRFIFITSIIILGVNLANFGLKANPIEKAALIAAAVLLWIIAPPNFWSKAVFSAIIAVTFLSGLLTDWTHFSWGTYFSGLISLSVPLIFIMCSPNQTMKTFIYKMILLLPFLYLGIGFLLQMAGIKPIMRADFLGAVRLSGSTLAAYMSASSAAAVLAGIALWSQTRRRRYCVLASICACMCLLAGGRMAFAIMLINALPLFYFGSNGRLAFKFVATYAATIFGAAALFLTAGTLIARFQSGSESGRDVIKEELEYLSGFYPNWGVGLGHQYIIFPEELTAKVATVAAHDEYLRLQVEIGMMPSYVVIALIGVLLFTRLNGLLINNIFGYLSACASVFIFSLTDNAFSAPSILFVFLVGIYASSENVKHPSP